jgi:hypothetical protein
MTDLEARAILLNAKAGRTDYEAFDRAEQAILKLDKIKTITERALRSSDPINLYKSLCINEIAEVLGVKAPDPAETESKGQITIDDII